MTRGATTWFAVGGLLCACAGVLAWQQHRTNDLQRAVERLRDEQVTSASEAPGAASESARTESELNRLREDRAALQRLRAELDSLKQAAAQTAKRPLATGDLAKDAKPLPSSEWKHAGRASPGQTLETVLWAGLHRNLDVMTSALAFQPGPARGKAEALLATLDSESRTFFGSPERLIAHLTTQEIAFDAMQVAATTTPGNDESLRALQQSDPEIQEIAMVTAVLHRQGKPPARKALFLQRTFDGWKMLVPPTAVDHYAAQLAKGATAKP